MGTETVEDTSNPLLDSSKLQTHTTAHHPHREAEKASSASTGWTVVRKVPVHQPKTLGHRSFSPSFLEDFLGLFLLGTRLLHQALRQMRDFVT